jgi:hypothetical protein
MHYLTELAGKLVTTYQDRENLSLWVSDQSPDNQQALIGALRSALEQEVAAGRLRYDCLRREDATAPLPSFLVEEERRAVG